MRPRSRTLSSAHLDAALHRIPGWIIEHARWGSRIAGALALGSLIVGLLTGALTVRYAWLHIAVVASAAVLVLAGSRARRPSQDRTLTLVGLGVLAGAFAPWNAAALTVGAWWLPLLALIGALGALGVEVAARRVGVVVRLRPAVPVRALPAPGWYPDPERPSTLRWWDGTTWTANRRVRTA